MKTLLAVAVFLLISARPVHAVTVLFGGTINVAPLFPGDYGLGINVGDHFIGRFSYDLNAAPLPGCPFGIACYPATDFSVRIGSLELIATDSLIRVTLGSGPIASFSIVGALSANVSTIPPSCPSFICSSDHLWMALAFMCRSETRQPIEACLCPYLTRSGLVPAFVSARMIARLSSSNVALFCMNPLKPFGPAQTARLMSFS